MQFTGDKSRKYWGIGFLTLGNMGNIFLMNSAAMQEENKKNNEIILHVLPLISLVRYAVVVLVYPTLFIINFHFLHDEPNLLQ